MTVYDPGKIERLTRRAQRGQQRFALDHRGWARQLHWLDRVQALSARYQARFMAWRGAVMQLARPWVGQTITPVTWTFSPHIRLNLSPVVHQYMIRQTGLPPASQPQDAPPSLMTQVSPVRSPEERFEKTVWQPSRLILADDRPDKPVGGQQRSAPGEEELPPAPIIPPNPARPASQPARTFLRPTAVPDLEAGWKPGLLASPARGKRALVPLLRVVDRLEAPEERLFLAQPVGLASTRLVQSIAQSASRIENGPRYAGQIETPSGHSHTSFARLTTPATVLVRRGLATAQPARNAAHFVEESEPTRASGQVRPPTGGSPQLPDINLQRLTDQVVQIIDRRILAHRERTGNLF